MSLHEDNLVGAPRDGKWAAHVAVNLTAAEANRGLLSESVNHFQHTIERQYLRSYGAGPAMKQKD